MKNKIIFTTIIANLLFAINLFAQVNTDALFQLAIEQSKSKDYEIAIDNANKVLDLQPERYDVSIFIANVYAWQGNMESSKEYINKAYNLNKSSSELYDTWLNVLLWNGEYNELLKTVDIAVNNDYKNHYNIALKQLLAYNHLGEYSKAIDLFADEKNKGFLDSTQVRYIYNEIFMLNKQNTLTAYYSLDFFDNNDLSVQHLAFIDYAFKIRQNSLLFRVNYANRFDKNGVQLEVDYYQVLKNNNYLYFNYGYGIYNDVFPKHRAGLEYYVALKRNFEASLGARYMNFPDNHVPIITGHIGKYLNSFWFALRPYYSIEKSGNSISGVGNIRKYGKSPLSYWGLELGFGNSPDERYILDPTGDYFRLSSYRIKLEKNVLLGKINSIRFAVGYAYEETTNSNFRNRYVIEIIYKLRSL